MQNFQRITCRFLRFRANLIEMTPGTGLKSIARPFFRPTEVLYAEQFAFGHREIFQLVGILGEQEIVAGTLQHGWIWDPKEQQRRKILNRKFREVPHLVWSDHFKSLFENEYQINCIVTGSPWAHFIEFINEHHLVPGIEERDESYLYFPMHGFRYVNAKPINLETILLFLGNPGNLTISLYWTEYLDSILRDSLSDFGIQIVNSGYRGNGPFEKPSADIGGRSIYLLNVFKHICSHNKIICDEASTAFWYALSISKTIYLANSIQEIRGIGSDKSFYSYNNRDLIESLKIKYEVISKDFLMIPPVAENVEIAKTLLGFGIDLSRAKKDIPTLHNIEVDNSGLERVKSKLKSKMN